MAELDPYIIFRQKEYSGPTQDELDAKQDMNALRNMLGAGQSIDSPEVVNAMTARNPDLGIKLMTNASTMRTNAASAQKSIADAQAKDRETRMAQLDRLFPVGMAIAQNQDQQGWTEFGTHLGQQFPEALTGYPQNVKDAPKFLQDYLTAKQQFAAKGSTTPFNYDAPVSTDQGYMVLGPDGQPRLLINPATNKPFMKPPNADGGSDRETYFGNLQFARKDGKLYYAQPSNRGGPLQWQPAPPEMEVMLATRSVETGLGTQPVTTLGGLPTGPEIPKDVEGEARAKRRGDLAAVAEAAAGSSIDFGTVALQQIDGVLNDPNLSKGTGLMSMVNFIPGTGSYAFQAKVDQVTGAAFLQGIQRMQGTGAITEIEGAKATAALTRAMTGLSEPEFRKAMEEYRAIVAKGLEKARALEGKRTGVSAEQPAGTAGAGANPADPLGLLGGK
jgi:hypothetical protein